MTQDPLPFREDVLLEKPAVLLTPDETDLLVDEARLALRREAGRLDTWDPVSLISLAVAAQHVLTAVADAEHRRYIRGL